MCIEQGKMDYNTLLFSSLPIGAFIARLRQVLGLLTVRMLVSLDYLSLQQL